jgi:hypothetical protein
MAICPPLKRIMGNKSNTNKRACLIDDNKPFCIKPDPSNYSNKWIVILFPYTIISLCIRFFGIRNNYIFANSLINSKFYARVLY